MISPFLVHGGGNCQDAVILVEFFAVREKALGGLDGTEIEQLSNKNDKKKKTRKISNITIYNI